MIEEYPNQLWTRCATWKKKKKPEPWQRKSLRKRVGCLLTHDFPSWRWWLWSRGLETFWKDRVKEKGFCRELSMPSIFRGWHALTADKIFFFFFDFKQYMLTQIIDHCSQRGVLRMISDSFRRFYINYTITYIVYWFRRFLFFTHNIWIVATFKFGLRLSRQKSLLRTIY